MAAAITITGTGSQVSSNPSGTTISSATTPVSNTYTAGQVITFSNAGAVIDTSTAPGSAGIVLSIGSVAGATDFIRNSGSIQAYSYGIETTPHGTTTNAVSVSNSGIINIVGGVGTAHNAAGIYANGGVQETVDNTGTIIAPTGVFLLPNGANGTFAVSNEGVITATQQFTGGSYKYGIRIQGNPSGALAGTAIITNTGTINGFVDAAVLNATITNKGTITAGVFALGTGTFIDAAGAVNGAKVQFVNQNSLQGASGLLSTLDLVAGTVAIGTLSNPSVYTGFGYVTVATGADFQIGNAASAVSIPNVTSIADFGTLNIAGSITGTSINMEGTVTGVNSVVDFTGTNTSTPIYDYANNDQVIFGTLALPAPAAGSSFQDSYNTGTGVLTVTEINSSGASVASVSVSLTNSPGTISYNANSFNIINGPGGETVALATAQVTSGSIYLDYGKHATLANSALDNVNVTFGPNGSVTAPNVLDLNGVNQNVGNLGSTFASNIGTVSGFGLNDIITLGTNNIASQPTDVLQVNYNSATGAYQVVDETAFQRNYAGLTVPAEQASINTITFSSNPGVLVETYGTNGINIETAATDAEQGYTFNASGTANINTIQDYSGSVAPGSSIVSGEVVTIASGTATFTSTNAYPLGVGGGITFASTFVNSGTILVAGTSSAFTDYSTLTGGGTVVAANGGTINILDNSGGTDAAQTLLFGTGGTSSAPNTIDLNATSGTFAGTIAGFGPYDALVLGPNVLPTVSGGTATTSFNPTTGVLTVSELNSGGTVVGTATETLTGDSALTSAQFTATQGPNGVTITDSIYIDNGKHVTLSNTAVSTTPVTFGTNGTALAPNVLQLNGPSQAINGGAYYASETGPITGFGTNDIITFGTSNFGALPTDVITSSYDTLTGKYQLFDQSEYQRTGNFSLSTDAVFFSPAGSYSASSFVETFGTNGVNIETPTTDAEQGYTFNASGTADINTIADYSGSVAPGFSIVSGEIVTIASGTATFAATSAEGSISSFVNSGTILVSGTGSAFTDYATLTGGGTVVAANGGTVNILSSSGTDAAQTLLFGTGGTSIALNTIDLNPTSGSFAGTIAGFGLNDDIVLGTSVLPTVATGSSVTLSYAGSLLTVGEVNSAGTVTASTTINVGTGYSTSSFVALLGTNGINIETPATVDEKPLTFTGTAGTISSFENPTFYAGGLAPGSTIVPGETVIVASGTASISSTSPVTDNGTIIVSGPGSTLIDGSTLGGTGTAIATNGGTISVPTSGTTDPVNFVYGTPGTALSPNVINFTGTNVFGTPIGTVSNIGSFDNIVLAATELPDSGYYAPGNSDYGLGGDSLSYNSATGQIVITDAYAQLLFNNGNTSDSDYAVTINSTPGLTAGNFRFTSVAGQGFVVSYVPCFAAGTRILTSDGQVAVEDIAVGDKVLTFRNGAEAEVVWVGSRTVDLARHAMPEKVRPIRILAGAFGEGLPERDLRLSPDHALFIDGHLIEAKTLVNGVTVIEEMATRFVTYHHVELANHDIMLAEGLAAESYLDSGNRVMFESDAAPMMLHPDFAAASREKACAPLAIDGDVVVAARARLLERAVSLGFTVTGDLDLTARVAGQVVTPEIVGEELLFVLPSGADSVELVSSAGVPAETSAQPGDRRVLGVAVTGLALVAGGKRMVISLEDPAHTGFYGMENGHRWTNGAARLALPAYTGRAVLEVTINGQAARWVSAA